jgi:flagellar biosynthetic protein FliR
VDRLKLPSPAIFQLVKDTGLIFVIAIKIGAPVIMSLLVTSVALGLIARTIPQMNVFIVGFPLKIGMALIVLGFSFPFFSEVFHRSWEMIKSDTNLLLQALGA